MSKRTAFLYSFLIIFAISLVVSLVYLYQTSCEEDRLIKIYYVGGVISSIFAFGAFLVAVIANRIQNKTSNLQRFETTFFNMLNLQQQITNDLIYRENLSEDDSETQKQQIIQGRELFRYFWDTLTLRSMSGESVQEDTYGYEDSPFLYCDGLKNLITNFGIAEYRNQKMPSYFDHYFRHLYTIIKFVHSTDFLSPKEKYKYTSIVRATLSRYELIWLYYNCLYGVGIEKFKPLVETYSLLKNMREDLLALSKENKEILISKDKLKEAKRCFSGTDYEFYLTDKETIGKYNISAFYNEKELDKGKSLIKEWHHFLND